MGWDTGRRRLAGFGVLLLLAGSSRIALSTTVQTQTLTINFTTFNELGVGSTNLTLTVNTVSTVGNQPDDATQSTTYALTTNDTQRKITAKLDSVLPAGVVLKVNLAAPGGAGGTSAGDVDISDGVTTRDVVTAINKVASSGRNLTYTLHADVSAGAVNLSRSVTLTLTAG